MTKDEALTMCLEYIQTNKHERKYVRHAIKAALEQQAEPCIGKDPRCPCQDGDACHYKDCGNTMAWPVPQAKSVGEVVEVNNDGFRCEFSQRLAVGTKLYTVPPAESPVQEPVTCRFCHSKKGCWAWQCYHCGEIDDVQKPTPPAAQRPWVGLTDEEVIEISHLALTRVQAVQMTAAILKEKNT